MQKRSFYLDWVRVISIGLVFLFHCGRFFDHEDWHVKNNTTSELATQAIYFMSRWIMPLFFFYFRREYLVCTAGQNSRKLF